MIDWPPFSLYNTRMAVFKKILEGKQIREFQQIMEFVKKKKVHFSVAQEWLSKNGMNAADPKEAISILVRSVAAQKENEMKKK